MWKLITIIALVSICVIECRYESSSRYRDNTIYEDSYSWSDMSFVNWRNWANMFKMHPRSDQVLRIFIYSSFICVVLQTISIFSTLLLILFKLINNAARVALLLSSFYLVTLFLATMFHAHTIRDILLNYY